MNFTQTSLYELCYYSFSFSTDDIKVKGGKDGINFAVYRGKPPTLICFVELESHGDIDKALQKHLAYMGDRYVEGKLAVFP